MDDDERAERKSGDKKATLKRCPECDFLYPVRSKSCTFCGYTPAGTEIIETDVELDEYGASELQDRKKKREAKRTRKELNKAIVATLGDEDKLRALAAEYGSPRAVYQWKKVFGPVWAKIKRDQERRDNNHALI